jgi:hypothetical protein
MGFEDTLRSLKIKDKLYVGNSIQGTINTQGVAYGAFTCGTAASAISVTPTDSIIPLQVSVTSIADSGTGGNQTIGATYFRTAALTAHQTGHQLATCMVRTTLGKNIFDAYGLQSHLAITASMGTANANAHLTAISGKVSFSNTPTVATGWITAGLFIIEGAGTVTQMCHGVSIVEESGSTGALSLLHLNTDVGTTPYLSLAGADGSGKSIYTHAVTMGATGAGAIKILVNGVARWIPFVAAE